MIVLAQWVILMASQWSSPIKVGCSPITAMIPPPTSLDCPANIRCQENTPGQEYLSLTPSGAIVNLNHFRLLRVVGKGAFGKVRIVERKDTGLTFALKYIRKDEGQQ